MGSSLTPPQPQEGLQPWEIEIAQDVVREFLVAGAPFPALDFEDLVQECLLHWLSRRERYREDRGASPTTYMRGVLKAKLLDVGRAEKAAKRGGGRVAESLEGAAQEGEQDLLSLGDLIADKVDLEREVVLRLSIQEAVVLLTPRQRRIVSERAAGRRITEISRRSGLSRDTLYEELHRIRQVFRDAGLEQYLS